jgi:hypothetical protein
MLSSIGLLTDECLSLVRMAAWKRDLLRLDVQLVPAWRLHQRHSDRQLDDDGQRHDDEQQLRTDVHQVEFADWVVEQGAENMAAFPPITITPTATLVSGVTALPSLGHGAVYPHNIVIDSTTYVTGYVAAPTAVVVADEAFYAP